MCQVSLSSHSRNCLSMNLTHACELPARNFPHIAAAMLSPGPTSPIYIIRSKRPRSQKNPGLLVTTPSSLELARLHMRLVSLSLLCSRPPPLLTCLLPLPFSLPLSPLLALTSLRISQSGCKSTTPSLSSAKRQLSDIVARCWSSFCLLSNTIASPNIYRIEFIHVTNTLDQSLNTLPMSPQPGLLCKGWIGLCSGCPIT